MRKITILTFLLIFLIGSLALSAAGQKRSGRPAKRSAGQPTLVGKAPKLTITSAPNVLGLTVKKYVSDYVVNLDGTADQTLEIEQTCANATCVERVQTAKFIYNYDLQRMRVIEAYTLKPGGKKQPLTAGAIRDRKTAQAEAAPGFSSLRELEIDYKGISVGDSAYLKIQLQTIKPVFSHHFDALEVFSAVYEWKAIDITVSAPVERTIYIENIALTSQPTVEKDGRLVRRWSARDLKPLELEPAMVDVAGASPRLAFTTFRDFAELATAFGETFRKSAVVTPEIQALAEEITRGIADPSQQASAIYTWVNKNIRYLSIVLDRGGWIPHTTTQILANRYGDCKDYTAIIYALLKARRIESHPVLIRSDFGDWFPQVATLDYFNHAVLYIPALDIFADATAPDTRLGLIPQTIVGKQAVIVSEPPGLREVRKNDPNANQILSETEIRIAANGSLKAFARNLYDGRNEILFRPLFTESLLRMSDLFMKVVLAYLGVEGTGKITKVGDPHIVGEPFLVEFETELKDFMTFQPSGKLTIPVGLNLMNMAELEQFVKSESRKTKLITGALRFRETYKIILPESVKVGGLPDPVRFENSAGSFLVEFKTQNSAISLTRELVIFKDIYPPEDYLPFKELVEKTVAALKLDLEYTSEPSSLVGKARDTGKKTVPPAKALMRESLLDRALLDFDGKPLPASEVRRLEQSLLTSPDDFETRKRLLRHYANPETRDTPARQSARLAHRQWLVRTHPEMAESDVIGWGLTYISKESIEHQKLRDEWLRQVAEHKTDSVVRLNAVDFLAHAEPEIAKRLLQEGESLHPANYKFPVKLFQLVKSEGESSTNGTAESGKSELAKKILLIGETALALIKKERSDERDSVRNEILLELCQVALELGEIAKARSFARELLLDFGQSTSYPDFDRSVHVGNITLGRVELADGNVVKAKEHLLTAMRATLRQESNYLYKIDMVLARELFNKGEKAAVAEYLRLALDLSNFKKYPESFRDHIAALKRWLSQIETGKTPSFDFEKP